MPNTNIQSLNYSDSQNQMVNKLNSNFDEIIELHGGIQGNIGITGGNGPIGSLGDPGIPGLSGERGTRWFVRASQPGGTGTYAVEGDYWVESSTTEIYIFTENGWEYTGYNLSPQSELFRDVTYTSLGGSAGTAITENQNSPSLYTFVIADNRPEDIPLINSNLSKFVISTDTAINDAPLLEFSKSDLEDGSILDVSQHPKIYWGSFNPSVKDVIMEVPGGSFNIGGTAEVGVRASSITLESATGITFDNFGSINATGSINLSSPSGISEISSYRLNVGATFANISKGLVLEPTLTSETPSIRVNSGATGALKTERSFDFFDNISHEVYNVKLESLGLTGQTESQFYINTKGKIKTNKVDGGITYPSSIPGATSSSGSDQIFWYLLARTSTPLPTTTTDYQPFPLTSGNTVVVNPYTGTSKYCGIGIYSDPDYSWGATGGLEVGQSIRVSVYCSNNGTSGNSTGFKYIGYGKKPSTGITIAETLTFEASAVDFVITRGATGPGTSVDYLAYTAFGGVGGSFYF